MVASEPPDSQRPSAIGIVITSLGVKGWRVRCHRVSYGLSPGEGGEVAADVAAFLGDMGRFVVDLGAGPGD